MSALHWLILIPYYYFSTMTLAILLAIVSRLLGFPVTMERLVFTSILAVVAGLTGLLVMETVQIDDFGLLRVVALLTGLFILAGLETVMLSSLPLAEEGSPAPSKHERPASALT